MRQYHRKRYLKTCTCPTIALSNVNDKASDTQLVNTMQECESLKKELSTAKRKIQMLNDSLAHFESENASLSTVITTLINEQQLALPSGYKSQTPTTEAQARIPNAKLDNTTEVVPMAASQTSASAISQTSATSEAKQDIYQECQMSAGDSRSYLSDRETNTVDFFKLKSLESDQTDLNEPIYRHNDEVAIRAFFIPSEINS